MRRGVGAALLCTALAACATTSRPPEQAQAYADYLVARIANLREDHEAAADRYWAALQRQPGDDALIAGAVAASLASGDSDRARQAARLAPRDNAPAQVYLVRAVDALAARRWQASSDALLAAQGTAAEELMARILLVWARTAQSQSDEVLLELAPLAQIRPYGGLLAYQQAMALDFEGRNEEAIAAYDLAARGGLWLPPAVERQADLLNRVGRGADAASALDQEGNRSNPALAAARARLQQGGPVAAAPLTPARGAAVGLYGMAAIFQQEGDDANALSALTLALMLDPEFDGARLTFAQMHARLGHASLARAAYADIGAASPYASAARVLDAWVVFDGGRHDEAIALLRTAADSGDARALRAVADMNRDLDRHPEAERAYSALLAAQPDDWRLLFARGAARERQGRWPEAEADFLRALELSPEQPDVMNYLGYSWVDRGVRLQEGLAMLQRAVQLRPHSGAILDSLGWAHFRLGDYDQALEYIERAVELEPADATLNDHLGDVYWRVGRRTEARFQWRRAMTLDPDAAAAAQAKLDAGLPDVARP